MAKGVEPSENKLHLIKSILGVWDPYPNKNQNLEVLLCCLRVGRTHFMNCYLLTNDNPPLCQRCKGFLGVLYMLWLCPNLRETTMHIFTTNIQDAFSLPLYSNCVANF